MASGAENSRKAFATPCCWAKSAKSRSAFMSAAPRGAGSRMVPSVAQPHNSTAARRRELAMEFMFQEPFVQLGVVVGLRPGIVFGIRINRQLHIRRADFFHRRDHALGFFKRHGRIF